VSSTPETSKQSTPGGLGGLGWVAEAPLWFNKLAHWLLTSLLGMAMAGLAWVWLNGGDRHDMASKFLFMTTIFAVAAYAVALAVYRLKRRKRTGSR
jgi:hypothetical protein